MDRKLIDKLMMDMKHTTKRLDFYEDLLELDMNKSDDFLKSSIEYYRKEKQTIREVLFNNIIPSNTDVGK